MISTGQSELEREVGESMPATYSAIKAGRALWLTGSRDNPYWQMLEFIRIANAVLKQKRYPKMRMLLTYDGPGPIEPPAETPKDNAETEKE